MTSTKLASRHSTRAVDNDVFNVPNAYIPRLQRLLEDIGYRYERPLPPNEEFLDLFDEWFHYTLAPVTSWTPKKLAGLKLQSSSIMERAYPTASIEMKLLVAKLTAIAILLDDSIEDDEVYHAAIEFGHRMYMGEPQRNGLLSLYHGMIKEASDFYGGDPVLRGAGVTPWINFIEACLLEKRLLTTDPVLRASPHDMGYDILARQPGRSLSALGFGTCAAVSAPQGGCARGCHEDEEDMPNWDAINFPLYLRHKSGIGEAYAAAIFKANRDQKLPLTRFIKVLPDILFHIEVFNDILSFYKEQIEGEDFNFVHLCHQSFRQDLMNRGSNRDWSLYNTLDFLCDKIKEAEDRIDREFCLAEWERRMKEGIFPTNPSEEMDLAVARQWRDWRDGYISWHLECGRYNLDHLKPARYQHRFM